MIRGSYGHFKKLCVLCKTNVCSCHSTFYAICIYRGDMGTDAHRLPRRSPATSACEAGTSKAKARLRQRPAKARPPRLAITSKRPRPAHAAPFPRTPSRERPSSACFLGHPVRVCPIPTNFCPTSCPIQKNMRTLQNQCPFLSLYFLCKTYI